MCQLRHPSQTGYWCLKTKACNSKVTSDGQDLRQLRPCLAVPPRLSRSHLSQAFLALGSSSQVWAEGYPTAEQTSRTPCLPLPGTHQWYRLEADKPVLQAMVGEAGSLALPPGEVLLSVWLQNTGA